MNLVVPWWERLGVPYAIVAEKAVDRRVLVVSHNAFLRRVISEFLSQAGATKVETRASAEQAVAQPLAEVDLVLAEASMPRENGLWLLKQIRTGRTGFPSEVPFVFIAESVERWLVESAALLDAGGCVLLPINAQKVEEAMKLALKRESAVADLTQYEAVPIEPPAAAAEAPREASLANLPACFARALPGATLVPVAELTRGMRLGADLLSDRGVVLLAAGTPLDQGAVLRLRRAADDFGFELVPAIRQGAA